MNDLKKKTASEPVIDMDVGTAADVEAVMKKYDRESNVRVWEGRPKLVISLILAVVLWLLTNKVSKTKKLHPIVFIGFSALVGIVFPMG